jgi:hypothetical protein
VEKDSAFLASACGEAMRRVIGLPRIPNKLEEM